MNALSTTGATAPTPLTVPLPAGTSWQARRAWLQARLCQAPPPGLETEEIEAHFSGMPDHYWEQVSEADLVWGLETVHGFLQLVATSNVPPTQPFVAWRATPGGKQTRLLLCTWDRHGMLAKAAAALSSVRLNILEAEAFTRADNIVLDAFTVIDLDSGGPANEEKLNNTAFLLEGALSEPPRFASLWMCSRHKYLLPAGQATPLIRFDPQSAAPCTLIYVEAPDRLGLLYDLFQTLADEGLDITQARIRTAKTVAHDCVQVRDRATRQPLPPQRLARLAQKLKAALALETSA